MMSNSSNRQRYVGVLYVLLGIEYIQWRRTFAMKSLVLVSLHIRSMWETICDAWACWSGWKFGPEFYSLPQFCNTEYPPPPPENENCQKSWHFDFSVAEYPPPPKNWNLGWSWHLDFSVAEYPPNWNLGRSWHLDFSVAEYPPIEI